MLLQLVPLSIRASACVLCCQLQSADVWRGCWRRVLFSSAVPAFEACRFAGRPALLVLHWPRHTAHASAEALLAGCVGLGLWIGCRSLEIASGSCVVLGASFRGKTGSLRDRELLAAANGQFDLLLCHITEKSELSVFRLQHQVLNRCHF